MKHLIYHNEKEFISTIEICRRHKCSKTIFKKIAGKEDFREVYYLKNKVRIIDYYDIVRVNQVIGSTDFQLKIQDYIKHGVDEIVQKDIYEEFGWTYSLIRNFYSKPDRKEDNPGGEWLRKQNIRSNNKLLTIMQTPEFASSVDKSILKSRNHENRSPPSYQPNDKVQ